LSRFGLILGYRPNSVRNFDWLPFTPPLWSPLRSFKTNEYKGSCADEYDPPIFIG
jgi:hypothetical protein